jgi:C-terminal processing protease CtpA/Prc
MLVILREANYRMRRPGLHRRLSAFLLLVLCFTTVLPFGNARGKSEQLSARERVSLFEQVWHFIGEKYYDANFNGVNWNQIRDKYRPMIADARDDAAFYGILKEMAGELHDAHTRFRSPAERQRARRMQATTPGITLGEVDGQPVIVNVDDCHQRG